MNFLYDKLKKNNLKICVIGLGYVGLPVAISFSKKYDVIGFDINKLRINQLKKKVDKNNSIKIKDKRYLKKIKFTFITSDLKSSDIFIITTPTPILKNKKPDLRLVFKALDLFKKINIKNKFVILESTVYPEASEKEFIPYLERITKMKINKDFYFGYSPERINPGDEKNNFENIDKIISGSDENSLKFLKKLYSTLINKIHLSPNIKTAEMAKVIENIQRDINIAFVNEVSLICKKFNLDSKDVLNLSETKWNFLKFKPGLVGGHCIGVDPYYLIDKLLKKKYKPKIILSGRDINEKYPIDILNLFLKDPTNKNKKKVLLLGITYKANCNDIRNSKSIVILNKLLSKKYSVDVFDPFLTSFKIGLKKKYNILKKMPFKKKYDLIIIAVDHNFFKSININILKRMCKNNSSIFDIKNIYPEEKFFRI